MTVVQNRIGLGCGLLLTVLIVLCPFVAAQAAVESLPIQKENLPTPVAAILPRTGQLVTYGADGTRIDFFGSGQDGEFQRGRVWPVPRFIVHNDGTVSDRLTGLMWLQHGECLGESSWPVAFDKVASLNRSTLEACGYRGTYTDWVLPSLADLASLFNAGEVDLADYLKLEGMRKIKKDSYWSSDSSPSSLNAWTADFSSQQTSTKSKISNNFILPVRTIGRIADSGSSPLQADDKTGKEGDNKDISESRFVVSGGTVTDLSTGLMWMQDLSCIKQQTWQQTLGFFNELNTKGLSPSCKGYAGNYTDWTLPNIVELQSLVDYARDFPALPPMAKFTGESSSYWSATTNAAFPAQAYGLNADDGTINVFEKESLLDSLLVRQLDSIPRQPRLEPKEILGLAVAEDHVLKVATGLQSEIQWPPAPRFFNNGDGTSLDVITGLTWLTDAKCFEKKSWVESTRLLQKFNSDARKYECKGYREGFDDWILPTIEELRELFNPHVKDSVAWLNSQGVENVQDGSDYLSVSETPLNLYYALVFNFKKGKVRNYPKTLKFYVWPRRILPVGEEFVPLLNMTVNSIDQRIELTPEEPISVNVYLHTFGHRFPADFWLWYETHEGDKLWLSPLRTWRGQESPVYQGDLFNLKNYEIFRSDSNDLAPGEYTIHFAVDAIQNGVLDNLRYEVQSVVTILDPAGDKGMGQEAGEPLIMFPAPE